MIKLQRKILFISLLSISTFFHMVASPLMASNIGHMGRLVDNTGAPLTGTANLQFEVHYSGNLTAGAILCNIVMTNVPLTNGVYHANINFADGTGVNCDLNDLLKNTPVNQSLVMRVNETTRSLTFDWQNILHVPAALRSDVSATAESVLDGVITAPKINQMGATSNQVLTWNGSAWQPQTLPPGNACTVTSVGAGAGLSDGGTSADPVLDVNVDGSTIEIATDTLQVKDLGITTTKLSANAVTPAKMGLNTNQFDPLAPVLSLILNSNGALQTTMSGLGVLTNSSFLEIATNQLTLANSGVTPGTYTSVTVDAKGRVTSAGTLSAADLPDIELLETSCANGEIYVADTGFISCQRHLDFIRIGGATNYVELRIPGAHTGTSVLTFPSTAGAANQVLTTDGTGVLSWQTPATSATPSGSAGGDLSGTYPNPVIAAGAVTYSKTNFADGAIPQAKISGLATSLSAKENTITAGATTQYFRGDKSWQTLDSSVVPENTNLYYTAARARADAVVDAIVDGVLDIAPSQNAVFDALALKQNTLGFTPVNRAGDTMTGNLTLNAQNELRLADADSSNYVSLRSPAVVGTNVNLTLPNTAGSTGQVLSTDGAGILSWITPATGTGDITDVVAGTGLTGGATSGSATLNVDVGTTASKIVQLDTSARLPAVDGSLLTNLPNPTTSTVLTGFTTGLDATVTNMDTVEEAIEKLQGQVNGSNTELDTKENTITAGATTQYYRGDKSWQTLDTTAVSEGTRLYFTQDRARTTSLTGLNTTAGTITAADSILSGLGKLIGNMGLINESQWTTTGSNIFFNTGNVGVGTSTPTAKLDVFAGSFSGTVTPLRSAITATVNPSSSNGYYIFKGSGGTTFSGGTVYGLGLDLSGGTAGVHYGLHIQGETRNYISGNLGIGVSTPAAKLDVDGQIKISGGVPGLGKVLTSDAAGLATWQALNTAAVAESGNLYYTTARARTDVVEDTIVDGVLNIAPSQNAVFDALALKANATALTNYVAISGSNMTGPLGLNAQNQLQFKDSDSSHSISFRAPASVTNNVLFTLPSADGSTGQVLSTDGAGNLAWTNTASSAVTNVTASAPLSSTGGLTPNLSISQANTTTNGFLSSTDWNIFNNKEAALAVGTTAQYYRGDKSWQTLNTAAVPESGNLYYTTARARTDAVADTILDGVLNIAPSQNAVFDALALKASSSSLSNYVLKTGDTMTGALNLPANGLVVGTNQLVSSGGNIGIGMTGPATRLDIASAGASSNETVLTLRNPSTAAYSTTNLNFYTAGAWKSAFWTMRDNTGSGGVFGISTADTSGAGQERLRITETGNVGIGTSAPGRKLSVAGNGQFSNSVFFTQQNATPAAFDAVELEPYVFNSTAGSEGSGLSIYSRLSGNRIVVADFSDRLYLYRSLDSRSNWSYFQRDGDNSFAPWIYGQKSRGTYNTPTAVLANDSLLSVSASGHNGSGFNDGARINFTATENYTSTAGGGAINFLTAPNGSTAVSNRMVIANNGNVGIGTSTPANKLHVFGNIGATGWVGSGCETSCEVSGGYVLLNPDGTISQSSDERLKKNIEDLSYGYDDLMKLRPVSYEFKEGKSGRQIGFIAQEVIENVPELVGQSESKYLSLQYTQITSLLTKSLQDVGTIIDMSSANKNQTSLTINSLGNVGVGVIDPTYKLHINGAVAGIGPYNELSDLKYKKNLTPLTHSINNLTQLNGYSYTWKADEYPDKNFSEKSQLGLIAQEVKDVYPEAVSISADGTHSVAYSMLIAPIIESIKELFHLINDSSESIEKNKREIASLKQENEDLKRQNELIIKRLEKLESQQNGSR